MKSILLILIALLIPIEISCNESSMPVDTDESEQNNLPDISSYPLVSTNQSKFYDNNSEISAPAISEAFYGQDAQYKRNEPNYQDNGDGTVTDMVTGLMWAQSPDMDGDGDIDTADKMTYAEALAGAESFDLAGYDDWRLPTIKE